MKTLFLDESGDHNLTVINASYPVFVLGGVVLDSDYASGLMTRVLEDFKRELFGRTDIILHTADITRNRNGFEPLQDPEFRTHFYVWLNDLMRSLDYAVIACAVLKFQFRDLHGIFAPDPYLHSFATLVERFCLDVVQADGSGSIVVERRDSVLDKFVEAEWNSLKISGTVNCPASVVTNRISALELRSKRDKIAGLEIADFVVSPIGRSIIGRARHEDWRIVEAKLLRDRRGEYRGQGLIVLP